MSNSKTVYNDFVRANLPEYIRYDSVRNQYVTANGKRFVTYKEAKWYTDYIIKNGSIIDRAIGNNIPQTIADFSDDTFTSANKNLGPELVTNGTFDTDISGWDDSSVAGGAISWNAAGYLDLTNTSGTARADTSMTVEIGKAYEVSVDGIDAGTGCFAYLGGAKGSGLYVNGRLITQGTNKIYVVPTATTTLWLRFSMFNTAAPASLDNVSVREVVSYSPASTTAASLLTHTRSGNAVQVADDGTLQWAGHNLMTYSEDFSNPAWNKSNATVTSNAETAPNGTLTADKLVADNGVTMSGGISPSCNVSDGYTNPAAPVENRVSLFAKAGEFNSLALVLTGGAPALDARVDVNLSTGVLSGQVGTLTPTIEDFGDGWFLITIGDLSNSTSASPSVRIGVFDSVTSTGDGTSGIYIWGAHLYRSDLGGMADIPTSYRGLSSSSTYLPTTSAARYLPRVDNHIWDGSSWVKRCLVEPQSTNLILNSDTLATQNVTVTAELHTLHFTGTGTVTLSGASTAGPLVGTGTGEQNRVSLQFTPTAGTLTLTVTGTVTNAQLETGVQTSYIPTAGSQVTRPADALSIDSTLLPYDSTAMTIALDGEVTYADEGVTAQLKFWSWEENTQNRTFAQVNTNSTNEGVVLFQQNASGVADSVVENSPGSYSPGVNVPFNIASRHTSSDINGAVDGTALTANTTVTALPDLSATDFEIAPTGVINIKSLRILGGYGATDAELEAATT